jgi:Tfp pilus assembly protein PilN
MINLLPQDRKKAVLYARYNRRLVGFVVFTVLAASVLIAGVFGINLFAKQQLSVTEEKASEKKMLIAKNEKKLKEMEEYLAVIKKVNEIYEASPDLSIMMADIGKTLRPGVRIDSLALNGDETQPLNITLISQTEKAGLESRITLEESERFSFVDIISTEKGEDDTYRIILVAAYEEGKAS